LHQLLPFCQPGQQLLLLPESSVPITTCQLSNGLGQQRKGARKTVPQWSFKRLARSQAITTLLERNQAYGQIAAVNAGDIFWFKRFKRFKCLGDLPIQQMATIGFQAGDRFKGITGTDDKITTDHKARVMGH
jgi:hypothetical protein